MTDSDSRNRSFIWATHFLRELYRCGVDHLVLSPGSRSTPLVMASSAHGGFKKHVVLDERSAAFTALGIGKATGVPAALICTSGTAAANYYPAVVEARQSGVPLLLLTADRPPHLRSAGASQAIDQIKLFGDYPVFFHEAGEPVLERPDLDRLRRLAGQAYHRSIQSQGPAHLNFPFRKPLEPEPEYVKTIAKETDSDPAVRTPATAVYADTESGLPVPERVGRLLEQSKRPVVISGALSLPDSHPADRELARLLGAPRLAEFPASRNETDIPGFSGFLRNDELRSSLQPDLIIRFGQQPVSKGLNQYLEEHGDRPQIHFADLKEWHDSTHTVTHRIEWFGRKPVWPIQKRDTDREWLERWGKLSEQFNRYRNRKMEQITALTDGHLFNAVSRQLGASRNVFLSNSFPVRDMLLFGEAHEARTWVNRGASGIDGVLSTAIGVAVGSGNPTHLFIGDLALLHDSNGLLNSKLLRQPLVVFLLNNGGGTIFRMLPIYRQDEATYKRYFETPQQADFKKLANAFDIPTYRIATRDGLERLDIKTFSDPGIHLVECRTDPDASMQLRESLWNFSP